MSDSGMPIRSDISSVLAQMRTMREAVNSQMQADLKAIDRPKQLSENLKTGQANEFRELLGDAIGSVNSLQKTASAQASAFSRGESDDLVAVMIAGQKASVGFQALTQVRNRVVSAYQDIMNMPI